MNPSNKNHSVFRRTILLVSIILSIISGCTTVQFVSPYDAVIDNGLRDYKESINTLAKNLADKAGTSAGTFQANASAYNALEAKIDLLIDRASLQSAGRGCKLTVNVAAKVTNIMGGSIPPKLDAEEGDSYGCIERLLVMVKQQLESLQKIHSQVDRCKNKDIESNQQSNAEKISCLRPATSKTAMKITNQSINAAWVVETAKRSKGEK